MEEQPHEPLRVRVEPEGVLRVDVLSDVSRKDRDEEGSRQEPDADPALGPALARLEILPFV